MRLKKVLPLLVTILIFVFFFYHYLDFKQLLNTFIKLSLSGIFGSATFYFLSIIFRTQRFRVLSEKPLSFIMMFNVVCLYSFYNKVLPLRTGELSYVFLMKRYNKSSYTENFSALVITRFYDVISAFLILLIAILFVQKDVINPIIVSGFSLLFLFLMLFLPRVINSLNKLLCYICQCLGIKNEKVMLFRDRILFFADCLTKANTLKTILNLITLSILIWLCIYGTFFILINQLGVNLSYGAVVVGSIFANFSNLLPVSGVGGFGTMEVGWAIGFTLIGLDKKMAVASGIVVNTFVFLCTVGMALFALLNRRFRRSSNKEDLINETNSPDSMSE